MLVELLLFSNKFEEKNDTELYGQLFIIIKYQKLLALVTKHMETQN